jgi:hypothetical protein
MQVMRFLLEDQSPAADWGASLKMLITLLVMFIVGIGLFIWWVKRNS